MLVSGVRRSWEMARRRLCADGLSFGFFDCSFPFCDNSRLLFQSCGSGTGNDRNCQKSDEGDWITGQGEIQFEKGIGKKIIKYRPRKRVLQKYRIDNRQYNVRSEWWQEYIKGKYLPRHSG